MQPRTLYPEDRVVLREVGLRDGLQLTSGFPDTAQKLDWMRAEHAAGVRHFELGSFLPAKRFPQFADLRELISAGAALPGAVSSALALNERGVADGLETGVDEIIFVLSATESHSRANTNRSRAEALEMLARIDAARRDRADPPVLTAGIAMAFGCSLEGAVEPAAVLRLAEDCARAGADVVAVADTVGFGGPRQVAQLADGLRAALGPAMPVAMHFHDTRGLGLANCAAALDHGIRVLDGSLGGLGGCPFAPGATGNAVFEDMAFLCETMGFDTGIDVAGLAGARAVLEAALPGETLHGALARAGLPRVLEPA
ncbi:hydroxymethylglutaryl-CoA lyase [Limimaricola pyoseonensis]|uniref:Hydroxymethylglutaryl-CoA lyase n=1 Tax=Limimaricola pyoseonensis TaxID=521013 RepID=A0A1G7G317_9RHOB|nr:hydroxymethylglutaryl-CoA lyase [Limimaricola pyoseonensis]SDE82480.1 hydroxymethylglutaryl-CoA lyase [Limimaricola pyoseonensis]